MKNSVPPEVGQSGQSEETMSRKQDDLIDQESDENKPNEAASEKSSFHRAVTQFKKVISLNRFTFHSKVNNIR